MPPTWGALLATQAKPARIAGPVAAGLRGAALVAEGVAPPRRALSDGLEAASFAPVPSLLGGLGEYAAKWAQLPQGSQPIANPLGGAPGFSIENVYVFPGLPPEMEAMFDSISECFQGRPIASWRRSYRTGEGQIVRVLEEAVRRHPDVTVGSYPRFLSDGPEVEVVLKSSDGDALQEAAQWVEGALEEISSRGR